MKLATLTAVLACAAITLTGCGGSSGTLADADAVVTLTVNGLPVEMAITRNGEALGATSDQCRPSGSPTWCTMGSTTNVQQMDFTLSHGSTPFIVYVTNNDTVERTVNLKIYISGVLRLNKDVVCQPTSTREGAQIS